MVRDFQASLAQLREQLAQAQARARRLRAEAFVRYTPVVAGQQLQLITLPLYNRLVAFESPFVCGGDFRYEDLLVFIWALHPSFSQFDGAARQSCYRAVEIALRPRHPVRNLVCRALAPFPRFRWLSRWCEPTTEELLTTAFEECARLVEEAIGDFPGSGSRHVPGQPVEEALPFPLQAQVLNLMKRELDVPFEETRSLPLKELAQHIREVVHTASKGRAVLMSREEQGVWIAYENLMDEQAAASKPADSPPPQPATD